MKQTILGAICLSLAASIWGGMYVVSKYVLDFYPSTNTRLATLYHCFYCFVYDFKNS